MLRLSYVIKVTQHSAGQDQKLLAPELKLLIFFVPTTPFAAW